MRIQSIVLHNPEYLEHPSVKEMVNGLHVKLIAQTLESEKLSREERLYVLNQLIARLQD